MYEYLFVITVCAAVSLSMAQIEFLLVLFKQVPVRRKVTLRGMCRRNRVSRRVKQPGGLTPRLKKSASGKLPTLCSRLHSTTSAGHWDFKQGHLC